MYPYETISKVLIALTVEDIELCLLRLVHALKGVSLIWCLVTRPQGGICRVAEGRGGGMAEQTFAEPMEVFLMQRRQPRQTQGD